MVSLLINYYQMNNRSSSQKKRFNIFKDNIFWNIQTETFKRVPYHFNVNNQPRYVFDHSNQTFNTISYPDKKYRHSSSKKNKIFDKRRSNSQQGSCMSSVEHTSRQDNSCGQKCRKHVIFKNEKGRFLSEQDHPSVRDSKEVEDFIQLAKTQNQTQKNKINLNHLSKNQIEKLQFYREQLEHKLRQREKQRITAIREFQLIKTEINCPPPPIQIMKPEALAKMIKQVRLAAKSKRNQIVYPIPRILSQVPKNDQAYIERQNKIRETMVYRI